MNTLSTLGRRILLVDGGYLMYRSYYQVMDEGVYDEDGNRMDPFWMMHKKLRLFSRKSPDAMVVCLDSAKNWRKDVYPEYKINRPPTPPDLAVLRRYFEDWLHELGVQTAKVEGHEGDDVIVQLARSGAKHGKVHIISPDKDFLHVLSKRISIVRPLKGGKFELETTQTFKQKFGYPPSRFLHAQALMGDSSDNIPGVPSIGEKRAHRIMAGFKNLDEIYSFVDGGPPPKGDSYAAIDEVIKRKEVLATYRDLAYLSLKLATQRTSKQLVGFWNNYDWAPVSVGKFYEPSREACSRVLNDLQTYE